MWPHSLPRNIQPSLPAVGRGQWSYSAYDFWRSLSNKTFLLPPASQHMLPKTLSNATFWGAQNNSSGLLPRPSTSPIQTGRDVIMLAFLFFHCRLFQKLLLKLNYVPRLLKISQVFSTNWSLITLMNRELLSCFFAKFKYYCLNLHNYPIILSVVA